MFGPESEITPSIKGQHFDTVYDANGGCVIPGLIDGHTHPVWAGDRVHEFAMKVSCRICFIFYSQINISKKLIYNKFGKVQLYSFYLET